MRCETIFFLIFNFFFDDLSIIVAPWPGSLIHDNVNSRHVKLWRKFCESRCKKFVNLYPYFFDYAEKNGKINTINKVIN